MAIWYSDSPAPLPMRPLGNGQILLWEEGAGIYSFQGGYSAPHLFSLLPDFGGTYHEVDSIRPTNTALLRHRLYYSDSVIEMNHRSFCDVQITDSATDGRPILIRRVEGISPLNFRLSVPSYVRRIFHPNYRFTRLRADVLFLTLPAGTAFENGMVLLKAQTAALLFTGSLRYSHEDSSVFFGGDLGELTVICYNDPNDLIHWGEELLALGQNHADCPADHPLYGAAFSEDVTDGDSALQGLWMLTAASGAVIASQREPYASAADLPALTALLLGHNKADNALAMLSYWTDVLLERGYVPPILSATADAISPDGQPDAMATAAYLYAAARYATAALPQGRTADLLFRGMRTAFSGLMQSFREGMLPFGMRSAAFHAGILGRELICQGSAEDTAVAILAAREYLSYCTAANRRIAKEDKGYLEILRHAEESYAANFVYRGKLCRNAPKLEGKIRRRRFIRGICDLCRQEGAYTAEDDLELDKYGRYLCRACFATRRGAAERIDPALRTPALRADAIAALVLGTPAAIAGIANGAAAYAAALREDSAHLPLREADTDPLLLAALMACRTRVIDYFVADGSALQSALSALGQMDTPTPEAVVDALIAAVQAVIGRECPDGTLPALLYGQQGMGARFTVGATALWLLHGSYRQEETL